MAFAGALGRAGFEPASVRTSARVHIEKGESGFSITKIELTTEAAVPGIEEDRFQEIAESAKSGCRGCPVSRALGAVTIELTATLVA
jgi:osmotically inducible protein OsmC